jgi:hypothetical protein
MDLCPHSPCLNRVRMDYFTWDHEETRAPAWTSPIYLTTLRTPVIIPHHKYFAPSFSVPFNATNKRNIIRYNLCTRTHKNMAFRYLCILISPCVLHISSISSLWFMRINVFKNRSKYLPPRIRSTAKRKHMYKNYILYMQTIIDTDNTVCITLSTRFSETYAVFSESYNTR